MKAQWKESGFGSQTELVLKASSYTIYTGHAQATLSLLDSASSSIKWESQYPPQNVVVSMKTEVLCKVFNPAVGREHFFIFTSETLINSHCMSDTVQTW